MKRYINVSCRIGPDDFVGTVKEYAPRRFEFFSAEARVWAKCRRCGCGWVALTAENKRYLKEKYS